MREGEEGRGPDSGLSPGMVGYGGSVNSAKHKSRQGGAMWPCPCGLSQALWDPLRTLSWMGMQQVLTVSRERWRPAIWNIGGASPAGKIVLCHTGITIAKALVSRSTAVLKSLSLTLHLTSWKPARMRLPHTHRLPETSSSQGADA